MENNIPTPQNKVDYYLNNMLTGEGELPTPQNKIDYYLYELAKDNKVKNTKLQQLENLADGLLEELEDNTVEGENITVNDSAEAPAMLEIKAVECLQESREGRNYFDINDRIEFNSNLQVDKDNWISSTLDNSEGTQTMFRNAFTNPSPKIKESTTYYLVLEVKSISGTGSIIPVYNADRKITQFDKFLALDFEQLEAKNKYIYEIQSNSDFSQAIFMLRSYVMYPARNKRLYNI